MGQSNGKPVVFTDQVNLNHFRLLRVVGKGAFGKVRIVERKDTGLTFALKYIRKDEVVRSESVRNIIRERRMLEHLNHPFLCNLRYSFQDIEYLYIVVDLMNGGDLRFHISRKTFTEEAVRFWIAQLGCAVRYIHQQGIVHRDIKPDNVLLDSEGHVHLADFNVASDFTPHKPLTSKSGTLAYLAPEVYEGKGYSCEVDWWSLGVLFYECIYNKRPFEASSHDSLAQKISKGEPTYPVTSPPVSMPCLHAISSLLEKDRKKRIGAMSFESFIDNPFFRPLDFVALERKEIPPVFIPSSDKTNFDATYDLEELLLEEAPLEARARRQKPREALKDDATDAEIRAEELHKMIETLFEPFNYTTVAEQRPAAVVVADPADSTNGSRTSNNSNCEHTPTSSASAQDAWNRQTSKHSQEGELRPTRSVGTARSTTHSPSGSPPLATAQLNQARTGSPSSQRGEGADYFPADGSNTNIPPSFSRPMNNNNRRGGPQRSTSMGGGVQVVLNETGSWSDMANQSSSLIQNPNAEKPSGMLGFLSRKKGRDRSPKAKERGVLGKEGARVIISNT
ncbi:kinase-like protein [Lentithecium fluviatile CBS 122367]|uniref:Kinase-like protein n=1 Tax=Lentithecium fluviatile CBS 122367 TaxID=1168545 RepID=A0A6G1JHP2_9PLEO|nr:kinase-like protein [Lentithecium fluviatile CBS 122367]